MTKSSFYTQNVWEVSQYTTKALGTYYSWILIASMSIHDV